MVQTLPMRGDYVLSFTIQGRPPLKPGEGLSANYRSASAGFFQALGIPLRRGRLFAEQDTEHRPDGRGGRRGVRAALLPR